MMNNFLKIAADLAKSAKTENRKPKQTLDFLKMLPLIDEDMSHLQPFVFKSKDELATDVPRAEDEVLACPFPLFSIELEDIALTCTESYSKMEIGVNIQAIICKEIAPAKYIFWTYNKVTFGDGRQDFISMKVTEDGVSTNNKSMKSDMEMYNSCLDIVSCYIDRMHGEKFGTFDANGRAKIKIGKRKAIYKPKSVIYVTPHSGKKYRANTKAQGSRAIHWDHAWTVRSHWRRLANADSLGKDRMGERKVKGYTFVGSYNKGDGIEILKIRRVK